MRIVVCLKPVVDTSVPLEIDALGRALSPQGLIFVPNPADLGAASLAARWTAHAEDESIVVAMGGPETEPVLRAGLAQGVRRGVLVHDPEQAHRDPLEKACLLAPVLKPLRADLILCGVRSADLGRGAMPGALAEYLGLPQVTGVTALQLSEDRTSVTAWRRLERGMREVVECPLPALVAVEEGIATLSYPGLPNFIDALTRPIERIKLGEKNPFQQPAVDVVTLGPFRPRPKKMLAPDSSLPAADRLRQLMNGGTRKAQATDVVTGTPEELAAAFLRFLQQQRIL